MPELLDPPRTRRTPAVAPAGSPPPAAGVDVHPDRLRLSGVSWEEYERLDADPAHDGKRFTYDARTGELEIELVNGPLHETVSRLLLMFARVWRRERGARLRATGSTSLVRRGVGRCDPDESLYVAHVADVPPMREGVSDLDAPNEEDRGVPPDVAMEVDVSSPGVAKLPIYHGLGVPEVWVWDHATGALTAHRRREAGGWDERTGESAELPGFPLAAAAEAIRGWDGHDDGELEDAFADRLRGG